MEPQESPASETPFIGRWQRSGFGPVGYVVTGTLVLAAAFATYFPDTVASALLSLNGLVVRLVARAST